MEGPKALLVWGDLMFWDSVVAGLNVLTYWETYAAGLEYIAIVLTPRFVMGSIMEKGERAGAVVGCMSMIVLPILQVLAMTVFVFTLAPIILGMNGDAAWSFPWTAMFAAPEAFFKMVGMLVVAAIVLSFIPLLGQLHSLPPCHRPRVVLADDRTWGTLHPHDIILV